MFVTECDATAQRARGHRAAPLDRQLGIRDASIVEIMESRRWNSLPQWRSPVGANVLLGVWLVVSTFAFHQTFDDALVTWILGALIAICSAGELVAPDLRYLDAMLAVLLGIAALVLPATSRITQVNQLCVAAAVLVFSLLSGRGGPRERRIRRGRTSAEFPL